MELIFELIGWSWLLYLAYVLRANCRFAMRRCHPCHSSPSSEGRTCRFAQISITCWQADLACLPGKPAIATLRMHPPSAGRQGDRAAKCIAAGRRGAAPARPPPPLSRGRRRSRLPRGRRGSPPALPPGCTWTHRDSSGEPFHHSNEQHHLHKCLFVGNHSRIKFDTATFPHNQSLHLGTICDGPGSPTVNTGKRGGWCRREAAAAGRGGDGGGDSGFCCRQHQKCGM
eukprot:gene25788-biopygen13554